MSPRGRFGQNMSSPYFRTAYYREESKEGKIERKIEDTFFSLALKIKKLFRKKK